jgi:hypothetical protein
MSLKPLKPFFTYYGGKYRAAPHYPAPQHDMVIEPFAGSAGYSLRHSERDVVLMERDPVIAEMWRFIQSATASDFLDLPDLADGQTTNDLNLPRAAKSLIGFWLNKGCASPCKRPSAWMRGGTHMTSFWGAEIRQRLASQAGRIAHWIILEGSYADLPNAAATWYVDPPYQNPIGRHYRCSDIDYTHLGDWVLEREGQTMVCEQMGATWLPFEHFRHIKANESSNGKKTSHEVIYTQDGPYAAAVAA